MLKVEFLNLFKWNSTQPTSLSFPLHPKLFVRSFYIYTHTHTTSQLNAQPRSRVISSYVTPWQPHSPVSARRHLGRVPVVVPPIPIKPPHTFKSKQSACQEPRHELKFITVASCQRLTVWSCNVTDCIGWIPKSANSARKHSLKYL